MSKANKISDEELASIDWEQFAVLRVDGQLFRVPVSEAEELRSVQDQRSLDSECAIDLDVSSDVLLTVLRWVEHHAENPTEYTLPSMPLRRGITEEICTFDLQFLKECEVAEGTARYAAIVAVAAAAGLPLKVPRLRSICAAYLAAAVAGKSPAEIREAFNLPDDLSDERKVAIARDNKFLLTGTY